MNNIEISKFRKILGARAFELTLSTRRRDVIAIEQSAEQLESRLRAGERELAMQKLEKEAIKLREVCAALRRIDEGTYGICEECEEPVSPKRLAAVPAAALCIRCQEKFDCSCGASALRVMHPMAA